MTADLDVVIVGSGFAGIGMGRALYKAGARRFAILERADRIGGTWRDNRYPGVACDVPSGLYSFADLPYPSLPPSSRPTGAQILSYLELVGSPLAGHIRASTDVRAARWNEDEGHWSVETESGALTARTMILACGRLTEPRIPAAAKRFGGQVVHTSRWTDAVSLSGRRVAVIGTGASGIQVTPHLVETAEKLVVLQRTPAWILPESAAIPDEAAGRTELLAAADSGYVARTFTGAEHFELRRTSRRHLMAQVPNPLLRQKLTPEYTFGCKRVPFSDSYYPALQQDNVALDPTGAADFTAGAVISGSGARHEVDVVVLATGFHTAQQPYARWVFGRNGLRLADHWSAGMRAYASLAVHGFPNMFVLGGPNAALSHSSAVLMLDAQINYALGAVTDLAPTEVIEVVAEAEAEYSAEVARRSVGRTWTSGCNNWYTDARGGGQVMLWPGTYAEYAERFGTFDTHAYRYRLVGSSASRSGAQRPITASCSSGSSHRERSRM